MLDTAGAFERDLSDSLGDVERAVLDRWDAGMAPADIARETGKSPRRVAEIVELYDDIPGPPVPPELVAANARYVAAVKAVQARAAMKRQLLAVGEIEALLEDRIESLVADLLPNARKEANEMCVGSLAGEPGQSLRVHIGSGSKRGWWRDFSGTDSGDALKLVAAVQFGGDIKKAVAWAKSWLHLDELDPGRIEQHRLEARARHDARARDRDSETARSLASAKARWHQGKPLAPGDPVCRYLAARGIDFAALGRAPGVARYHEALQYGFPPAGEAPIMLPAMVAMITSLAGDHIATHRTWLDVARNDKAGPDLIGFDHRGKPNKPKKVMGLYKGGHIPLWKGAHQQPLRDIPDGTDVYVSEGPEDGWTAACADPSLRVIAGISVGNYLYLELPPQMGRLIFLRQNDAADSNAANALKEAVAHHRGAGRRVMFVEVPGGHKDLNDLARAGMTGEG